MKINSNIQALVAQNVLRGNEEKNAASTERMSSGFKLNHAKDSPAGMAVSNRMNAQIRSLYKAKDNASNAVNVVPARAELELQIRAKTPEAIKNACAVVDRCVKAAAMAFCGSVEINNLGGYMPYQSCEMLNKVHADNLQELCGGVLGNFGHRGSSTDMGDVSMLIPALHAYSGGFAGSPHTREFVAIDPEAAYIQGAKLLAMDAVSLLQNNAAKAIEIANLPKIMDKKTYLEYKELLSSSEEYNYDQA